MRNSVVFHSIILCVIASAFIGCSGSNSTTGPTDNGNSNGDYVTDPSTMSPQPDSVMMEHLIDSSSFEIDRAYTKSEQPASLEDSLTLLVNTAIGELRRHIPYLWGGRHIDRATKWFSDNDVNSSNHGYDLPGQDHDNNADCPPRVGLDCSGFIQYLFEKVGFGRKSPDENVAGLNNVGSWDFMEKRGYHVKRMANPGPGKFKLGDVLFFQNSSGELSHIGVYCGIAKLPTGVGDAFIASAGYPDCDANYAREAAGHPTGVSASLVGGYWLGQLNSIIRFSQEDSLSGNIKLHVTMSGSATQQQGDMSEEKDEQTSIDYTIKLKPAPLEPYLAGGWIAPCTGTLSGSCEWTQTTKDTYSCNGGSATDVTTETWNMNGPDLSDQIFSMQFIIDSTGKYQFSIAPGINPQAKITHYHSEKSVGCGGQNPPPTDDDEGIVPFVQYLTPFICGAMGSFQGEQKVDHLSSSWNCMDTYPIFNTGQTPVTIPVNVQISWDLTTQ